MKVHVGCTGHHELIVIFAGIVLGDYTLVFGFLGVRTGWYSGGTEQLMFFL